MEEIGVYVHIPFCTSKCFYCDFCSIKYDEEKIQKYISALKEEILANAELLSNYKITSIYFGGGTPSLINEEYITQLLDIFKMFNIDINAEITIEINPKTVDEKKLNKYLCIGINRVSIGLQTIHNSTLKAIGRASTLEDFNNTYQLINKVGFKNISLDLIIGLPNETINMFNDTLKYISTLENLNHISCYSLEVHENTKLSFLLNEGYLKLPSDDEEREMKHKLDKFLEELGFNRYEISNYARPGFKSKHNLKYWTGVPYLGFGSSASSYIHKTRYTNENDIDKYIENINKRIDVRKDIEELTELGEIKEYIILHLRLKEGINIIEFKSTFKRDIFDLYKQEIEKLINNGLLKSTNDIICLTDKGEDLANIVWQEFI